MILFILLLVINERGRYSRRRQKYSVAKFHRVRDLGVFRSRVEKPDADPAVRGLIRHANNPNLPKSKSLMLQF
jgi:hypothetical protein